jgi:predicted  nucleic acid-binding Zn-ribbon protein
MSRISALYDLQQVDSNIDQHNSGLGRVEAALSDTATIDAARQEVTEAEAALKKVRSTQRDLEFESQNSEKHAQDLEKKLYGGQIKGVKEIQSAENEIANFRQRRKDLDDQSVEAMIAVEEAEAFLKTAKEKFSEVEVVWEKTAKALREERARLETELPGLQAERAKMLQKVMPADIPLYDKLRGQKQGVAVAEVQMGKICSKCRMELPMAKQREVKNNLMIVNCSSCGRILYARLG